MSVIQRQIALCTELICNTTITRLTYILLLHFLGELHPARQCASTAFIRRSRYCSVKLWSSFIRIYGFRIVHIFIRLTIEYGPWCCMIVYIRRHFEMWPTWCSAWSWTDTWNDLCYRWTAITAVWWTKMFIRNFGPERMKREAILNICTDFRQTHVYVNLLVGRPLM